MKIGILGLGKMGSAILNGIYSDKAKGNVKIYGYDPDYMTDYKIEILSDEAKLFETVDVFIFAIKPQAFPEVIAKLQNCTVRPKLIVSIAAGIKIDYLVKELTFPKVIRMMPNTACARSEGVITIAKSKAVSADEFLAVKQMFSNIGKLYEVKEEDINKLLPLNGSFPAFFYYFVDSFIKSAVEEGVSLEIAKEVVFNTIIGSTHFALDTSRPLEHMIEDVCSKGGTTIAGMDVLTEAKLDETLNKCYKACMKRAEELEK